MRLFILSFLILTSCSSGFLKYQGEKSISNNTDFEQKVQIQGEEDINSPDKKSSESSLSNQTKKKPTDQSAVKNKKSSDQKNDQGVPLSKKGKKRKGTKDLKNDSPEAVKTRQPDVEDSAGFDGTSRRPIVDPFQVGETVVHSVSYFAAQAGEITFKIKPMVQVNNKKSYNFLIDLKSKGIFSNFYSVDDQVETFLDYENLIPHVFRLHLKESAQLKEAQSYFDQSTLKATYWEKKYTEKNGNEEKKLEWDILPFSQNAFSGIYYMRIFKWEVGKEYSFRVSDNEKNIIFKGTALKKEKLSTEAGEFNTIKIKAQIVSRGMLEQAGDIYFWISDDDRKYIIRIEAKIKIGSLVSEVISINPGQALKKEN